MELSGYNSALKNYIDQALMAKEKGDFKKASRLFIEASEIAYNISINANNIKVKNQYHEMSEALIELEKDLEKQKKKNVAPTIEETSEVKFESQPVIKTKKVPREEAFKELDALIGLTNVKEELHTWVEELDGKAIKKKLGLKVMDSTYHMVFKGSPGTGKTTVARLVAQIFCSMGIVSQGQLVEVDRSDLVAGYSGQTAIKTKAVIDKAIGGILFIDEAYSLTDEGSNDSFGKEAIATLIKGMEDHKDDLVVIVAGYDEPMEKFLNSNPGMKSRFCNEFQFLDYTADELYEICERMLLNHDSILDEDIKDDVKNYLLYKYENRDQNFGNARDVRNFVERLTKFQCCRLATLEHVSLEDAKLIKRCDFEEAIK